MCRIVRTGCVATAVLNIAPAYEAVYSVRLPPAGVGTQSEASIASSAEGPRAPASDWGPRVGKILYLPCARPAAGQIVVWAGTGCIMPGCIAPIELRHHRRLHRLRGIGTELGAAGMVGCIGTWGCTGTGTGCARATCAWPMVPPRLWPQLVQNWVPSGFLLIRYRRPSLSAVDLRNTMRCARAEKKKQAR